MVFVRHSASPVQTIFLPEPCAACKPQTYKTNVGNASCVACPVNTSQAFGVSGATEITACQCNLGHYGPDGGPCQACNANHYKPAIGSHACFACHASSVSPRASIASAQCVCDLSYTSNNSMCVPCGEGKFKDTIGNQACTSCPAITVTVSPEVNPNDPAAPPATARTSCICGPGFFGPPGGPCAVCEAGFFCIGFISGGGASACYNEHALSPAGSADDSDCVCLPGYWLAPSMLCSTCPPNKYCPGDNLLYACLSNSTAPAQSTSEEDCLCNSGFVPYVEPEPTLR